ncbi:50S ribosomal protein L25/general stress protein Ctc [Pandoraea sp. XJJ-1]|uniref:Large ribosomal subunit protein bL25 n=1 Tax=Pandoraea cepalis TaxID=2508294 RepID=A0A5E4S223_9BURK|nr:MULTISPECIES: 50S ribosomal protein L25/general stress protein Ctc [Pandoraea]MBN9116691.1 50S ribosomal protein L25/general stress protein Ctc [Pandoraea sp.]OJY21525.1 MAG: 50S ribosomal protein L25/general stress protein Ctc [Pandoraea sp. 64-18]WAL83375.1 50S ribosomal protein L25/general stress protein Ctc [Pandoraea sp. XJJ-1]VVD69201.1 50S ribosomal protein L25/general stress protein Ctc [Pandoraea cepalis]
MKVVAFERNLQGTGASRRLRNAGKTTGIVYGGNVDPKMIELDHNALWHALRKEAFHSSILELEVAGQTEQVLLRDVQYHPFKQLVLHVDFQRVDPNKSIHVKVPLHFLGAENAPAVKLASNVISHTVNELDVNCLPGKLPEFLEVDLSTLEAGKTVHAKDVKLPAGVTLTLHVEQENPVVAQAVQPAGAAADEAAAPAAEGAAPAA